MTEWVGNSVGGDGLPMGDAGSGCDSVEVASGTCVGVGTNWRGV